MLLTLEQLACLGANATDPGSIPARRPARSRSSRAAIGRHRRGCAAARNWPSLDDRRARLGHFRRRHEAMTRSCCRRHAAMNHCRCLRRAVMDSPGPARWPPASWGQQACPAHWIGLVRRRPRIPGVTPAGSDHRAADSSVVQDEWRGQDFARTQGPGEPWDRDEHGQADRRPCVVPAQNQVGWACVARRWLARWCARVARRWLARWWSQDVGKERWNARPRANVGGAFRRQDRRARLPGHQSSTGRRGRLAGPSAPSDPGVLGPSARPWAAPRRMPSNRQMPSNRRMPSKRPPDPAVSAPAAGRSAGARTDSTPPRRRPRRRGRPPLC